MKGVVLLGVIAIAVAASAKDVGTMNRGPLDRNEYDCSGKPEGNYVHPSDCYKFISCTRAELAYEMDCPACHVHPTSCPTGIQVYNATLDSCDYETDTVCWSEQPTPSPPGPTPPAETTTAPPTPPTSPPGGGDDQKSCDPELCEHRGDCQDFETCTKDDNGSWWWVKRKCDDGMYYDDTINKPDGACVPWSDLSEELKEKYLKAPNCLACYWEEVEPCHNSFYYQAVPDVSDPQPNKETRFCPRGQLFDPNVNFCRLCGFAQDSNKQVCPCS